VLGGRTGFFKRLRIQQTNDWGAKSRGFPTERSGLRRRIVTLSMLGVTGGECRKLDSGGGVMSQGGGVGSWTKSGILNVRVSNFSAG